MFLRWSRTLRRAAVLSGLVLLAACGGGERGSAGGPAPGGGGSGDGRTYLIKPGANATRDMIAAMVQAAPGDVIQFDCGYFELESSLQLINTEDVHVKGCGKDRTVLSFKNNNAPEGILAVNVHGLWIEDLTVLDTGGNGIEFRGVDHGTIRRVRAIWSSGGGRESATPITAANAFADNAKLLNVPCTDPATQDPTAPENEFGDTTSPDYTVSPKSGRYGIYPVSSENILIEEAESIGASDAGIYVGQTNNAIIRKSRAAFNVFGFEIENVQGGEYDTNVAECNTGGFLIYDLDGLRQYGDRSIMHGNVSRMNNTYNFTSGGFVGNVPPGSGMITLSYDRIDIYDNVFENNNTGGIIHVSYELFPEGAGRPFEKRIDWYSEGVHIFRNTFRNNGNRLPVPTSNDIQSVNVAHFLPALVGLKNAAGCLNPLNLATCAAAGAAGTPGVNSLGYRGAHIVWDGLLDNWSDCPYPKDANGNDVPADARGKPQLGSADPNPECHYNQYKFDASKQRKVPDWWASCIDEDNDFSNDSLRFANFHGTKGLEPVIAAALADPSSPAGVTSLLAGLAATDVANFASSFNMSAHQCPSAYGGRNLPRLPAVVIPPFVRSGDYDPAPTEAEIRQLCEGGSAGAVNYAAAAKVNCPTLDQYHLFSNPEDPRSAPNGRGVPFSLTSKLFSDYTVKYRVAYIPDGQAAVYHDASEGGAISGPNMTIDFPAGTIIAKTFTVADEAAGTETPIETRLIIKRVNSKGRVRWVGLPYIWGTENGRRVARLALGGGVATLNYKTTDVDSGLTHSGSTSSYLIPNGNQCLSCHGREDGEPGAVPIGPKVRFLNKPYRPESTFVAPNHPVFGQNQIAYWCSNGLMTGCPADLGVDPATQVATKIERVPVYNKPGDAGFAAGSAQDVEARARAWLEVNCQHCHNVRGFAASTGLYLDSIRKVDTSYGICKRPTATGREGTDNGTRFHDINPGNLADSILPFRIGHSATTPAARMPPLARSVVDDEALQLIEQWIRDVVVVDENKYPGSSACGS
ncbi:parallel beta-helix domain-containing protein [Fontimonas sp. SYSU GA230001]|uniref:parallel beta-helix domain-containing protein n=1 Tax=Fontimonas sp. SYSU GA230001 TaxID=3142450 RepID=UPI0032B5ECF6